jgi:hypothetical protein
MNGWKDGRIKCSRRNHYVPLSTNSDPMIRVLIHVLVLDLFNEALLIGYNLENSKLIC